MAAAGAVHLLLALALPDGAGAQVLGGQAVEVRTGLPVEGLQVRLVIVRVDSTGPVPVDSVVTDFRGLFQIVAPSPAVYQLEFIGGEGTVTRGPVDTLAADAVIPRRYMVQVGPATLDRALMEFEVDKQVVFLSRHIRRSPPRSPG